MNRRKHGKNDRLGRASPNNIVTEVAYGDVSNIKGADVSERGQLGEGDRFQEISMEGMKQKIKLDFEEKEENKRTRWHGLRKNQRHHSPAQWGIRQLEGSGDNTQLSGPPSQGQLSKEGYIKKRMTYQ